ncbi:DNA polymerase III subunit gamma/tau [Pseudobdellovibrio exovorus]|uniref:DNA polymerase III subunit gamma/tau n=1 Tax=Pseudobdellovibrio exovorus JSS TaxID=1184267 RepID=M4V508_9BACT|nr:DNA polymerase III subunit gamma/tau [Pseudobdellovibrio exovorus]AGH94422.1 DNA polymerase III gamma and tau subunits [Pseudobdellovibrio exovorus JSS]
MSYQVIARKYRPQSFDQMVGQNHITQTISNALKHNRLPHALLFTGLRGTGKTSSARILAKILRCTNPQNFTPCNTCQSCQEISAGRAVDVIEIDGASNNGVDAIRDLRDNVMFAPSSGKYKVFIIDEVHMLSTSAFNALLKTLEEPPAHVIFILATTEVHKIPQTILSRCQRFDFRRIPLKQIAEYLKKICELENIQADAAALWLIAKQGDGSMRDSLSLLDQVISFTNGQLTESEVGTVLGLTSRTLVYEVFDHLLHRQPRELVDSLEKLSTSGQNPSLFFEDLAKLLRHSLLLKADANATDLIDLPEDEIQLLIGKVQPISDSDLHLLFDMVIKASQDLNRASDQQIVFEMALLRMSQAPRIMDLQTLLGQAPSAGANRPKPSEVAAPQPTKPAASTPNSVAAPTTAKPVQPAVKAPPQDLTAETWLELVQNIKSQDAFFAAKIENLLFLGCKQLKITLQAPQNLPFLATQMQSSEMQQKLQGFIDSALGQGYTFEVLKSSANTTADSAHTLATKKLAQAEEELLARLQSDPRVQKAKEVFKSEIKIVKKGHH